MMRRFSCLMFSLIVLTPMSSLAQVGVIGLYGDLPITCSVFDHHPQCSCLLEVPPFVATTFYILAKPYSGLPIAGAEFRVKGKPTSGLILVSTPNAAADVVLGDPFSDETQPLGSRGGVNIAWPACQEPDASGFVLLFAVVAINTGDISDVILQVVRRDPPTNLIQGNFPLINACDAPVFTAIQVLGGCLHLNPIQSPVDSKHWGEVKGLYQ